MHNCYGPHSGDSCIAWLTPPAHGIPGHKLGITLSHDMLLWKHLELFEPNFQVKLISIHNSILFHAASLDRREPRSLLFPSSYVTLTLVVLRIPLYVMISSSEPEGEVPRISVRWFCFQDEPSSFSA